MAERERLHIALAIGTLERGGAETQLVGMARELQALGHNVEVLLLKARGPLYQDLADAGIPTWCAHIEGFQRLRSSASIAGAIRSNVVNAFRVLRLLAHVTRGKYDVMHAFLFHTYTLLMPWSWMLRIPVRISGRRGLHASLPKSAFARPATRLSIVTSTIIIANSHAVAADATFHENVPRSKMRVIHNGVQIPALIANPMREPPAGLLVGNLIRYKGHLDLIEAVKLLPHPMRREVRIFCVGEGVMRAQVEDALRASELETQILLAGSQPAGPFFARAQYALLVSHEEGLPNAILEAMAAGLPVIATDVGGCRELVKHGVTGLLVPRGDHRALSEAIERVMVDRSFRVQAGLAGRDAARSFGWDRNARAHLDLYYSSLGSK